MKLGTIKGILYSSISAIIYGIIPLLTKEVTSADNATLTGSMALRYFVCAIFAYVFAFRGEYSIKVNKKQLSELFFIGAGSAVITNLLLVSSYGYISLGLATVCHFFYPVAVCIIMYLIFQKRVNRYTKSAVICTITALILLIYSYGMSSIIGMGIAVVSGIGWAIHLVAFEKASYHDLPQPVSVFYIMVFSLLFYTIFTVALQTFFLPTGKQVLWITLAGIGLVSAVILTAKGISLIGSTTVAFISLFEPITCMITDLVVYHNVPQGIQWAGYLLMLVSIVFVTLADTQIDATTPHD